MRAADNKLLAPADLIRRGFVFVGYNEVPERLGLHVLFRIELRTFAARIRPCLIQKLERRHYRADALVPDARKLRSLPDAAFLRLV